jgi:DNA-binding SARP family transcriptional activator/ABC-type glycerol-3-phosphate transport system substrate-binding protein
MEYRILGPLDVRREGVSLPLGSFKQRAVLGLLLVHRNEVVSTDRIIDEVWGDEGAADRKNALHVYLSNLRKVLEPERAKRGEGSVLLTRAPGYSIHTKPDEVDADRFERLTAEGRVLIDTDPASASIVLGEALALWRGLPLEEFTYESFAQAEITRLSEFRSTAVEDRIDASLARGLSRELVAELEGLVREYPLRERLTGQLMLALYRSGRQAEALRAYQLLRSRLGEELGIEPSRELRNLEEEIVLGEESLLGSVSGVLPGDERTAGLAVRGYELRQRIGSGRFGIAYRAFQPAVGREVAVKVIRPELADHPEFIRRFEEEAQLVARLEDPHIVPLYDYWREPGAGYLVMRFMQGGNLEQALAAGPMDRDRVAKIVAQVGGALETAHHGGVVHRDIKPENILIDAEGNAYLADFGIAVGSGPGDSHEGVFSTLEPPYASPEYDDGDRASPASDIYSLAAVAAHALTGRRGDVSEMIVGMDPAVADVLARAASPEPGFRYRDAGAFGDALAAALDVETEDLTEPSRGIENPYKGLRAFQQADAPDFFGRERLVERLVARMGRRDVQGRFVAVVGPSGSGKSSVVRAGLLPALRRGALPGSADWYQIEMTPGRHPFEALEEALLGVAVNPPTSVLEQLVIEGGIRRAVGRVLPDERSQLVVVIDQFEELYTLADPATADRFLAGIVDAVTQPNSRIRVVATLRADFYDRPLSTRSFGELLRHGTEIVTPMSPQGLERAINGPAGRVGVEVSPSVAAEMIKEIADRPGALPLLQYALTELFEQRRGATITADAYRTIGGVAGALGARAESLFNGLDPAARDAARPVFLRLVSYGEGDQVTRRRVLMSELASLGEVGRSVASLVETFGRHRLLTFDRDPISRGPTVEISHEALLREWPRLRRWIEDGRSDVRAQRRLGEAASEWRERDEDPDFVFTGARITRYDGWLAAPPVILTADETRFLEAGVAAERRREADEQERARREGQLRRRSWMLVGLAAVTIFVVALGVFALVQRQRAEGLADEIARAERSGRLTSESVLQLGTDPELATMLAIEAARSTSDEGFVLPQAVDALHGAIQTARVQYPVGADAPLAVRPIAVSDGAGPTGVFLMPPDDLIGFAQTLVGRNFSEEECSVYFVAEVCPDPGQPLPNGLTIGGPYHEAEGAQPLAGTTVDVVGEFFEGGADANGIKAALAAVSERTGIEITYRAVARGIGGADFVRSGQTADIVAVPQPGEIQALAADGHLIDLSTYLDPGTFNAAYSDYLRRLVTVAADGSWPSDSGGVYGVWVRLNNKTVVWHASPDLEASGYPIPETWDDVIALSDRLVADGETPWCLGIADPGASGWLATDWIESIVLRSEGPEFYDQWVNHEVPFDHPAVVEAARKAGLLAFSEGYVSPAPAAIVDRLVWDAAFLVGEKPPPCWLLPLASFAPGLSESLTAGENLDVIDFPAIDPRHASTAVGGGDVAVALTDRPEVRAVIQAIAFPEFGEEWAAAQVNYVPPHRNFDLETVTHPTQRRIAELTLAALESDGFRFDASDLMPPAVGAGTFWSGMTRYFLEGPDSLEEIMAEIEASWVAAVGGS